MRVTVLASGSSGNATVLEGPDGSALLVDAGIGPRAIQSRFERATGRPLPPLSGILLTHAHGDHAGCADGVARALQVPLYLSASTRRGLTLSAEVRCRVFGPRTPFNVGTLAVAPIPVPHDAPQVGLRFDGPGLRLGLVTDLGQVTEALVEHLSGCDVLLCESNHDLSMLRSGPYPEALKSRIASARGHLDNAAAATLLGRVRPRVAVLMHLSRTNNLPALATRAARRTLPRDSALHVAHHDRPLHLDLTTLVGTPAIARARQLEMF